MAARGRGRGRGQKSRVYGQAAELPPGELITDFSKKQWRLGTRFASGGFGHIYFAKEASSSKNECVVKMEPAENGPLFSEIHVYQRICKQDMLNAWKKTKNLNFLGIPPYVGAGLYRKGSVSFRFLVMPKYGCDVEKIRLRNGGKLSTIITMRIGITCLNALEYLQSKNYVHADVKAENLLTDVSTAQLALDRSPAQAFKVYLVDFGLARRVSNFDYKEQPKKAHDGTLPFTSTDAHNGVSPIYRGDVEILAYNLLYWLTGALPWSLQEPNGDIVAAAKAHFRKTLKVSLAKCLKKEPEKCCLSTLQAFFEHVYALAYSEIPDYDLLVSLLNSQLSSSPTKRGRKPKPLDASQDSSEDSPPIRRRNMKRKSSSPPPGPARGKAKTEKPKKPQNSNHQPSSSSSSSDKLMVETTTTGADLSADLFDVETPPLPANDAVKPWTRHSPRLVQAQVRFKPASVTDKIPGLANLKSANGRSSRKLSNPRRSMEASIVKKYLQQQRKAEKAKEESLTKLVRPALREKPVKNGIGSKRRNAVHIDDATQTSPGWY